MVRLNRVPGLMLENWNVGVLDMRDVTRPSVMSSSSARKWDDLDLVFSWQEAERELSLVVTLQPWTPGKFTWARRKIEHDGEM